MLAYTTFTSFIYRPSLTEVLVYLAGLLVVITVPSLIFNYLESKEHESQDTAEARHRSS